MMDLLWVTRVQPANKGYCVHAPSATHPFGALVADPLVPTRVLDGGFATELERRGADLSGALWSARLLRDDPAAIQAVHEAYFAAGAEVATTASYQASYPGFAAEGLDAAETTRLLQLSVALADRARQRHLAGHAVRQPLWVAASVGPFGAALHDGSEYHGNYGVSRRELQAFHRERLHVLAGAGADILACETIPSLEEAAVLAELLRELPAAAAWVSFTAGDERHTAHGEPLVDCARLLDAVPQVRAIGVNCVRPSQVTSLVRELRRGTAKPILVYPNSGERWDGAAHRWVGAADAVTLETLVAEWITVGASWIGGCCRTTPDDITRMRRVLDQSLRSAPPGQSTPPAC
jgi:homocysteine S-methyltransferase